VIAAAWRNLNKRRFDMTENIYPLRAANWKFSDIGIKPGEELVLMTTIKCRVVDGEQSVEYGGEIFPALHELAKKLGCWSETDTSAPGQFTYKGVLLSDIRKQYEK
jgi:uncharacterized protein CbrC (UPF0167 family)